jgi:hypothetical protein
MPLDLLVPDLLPSDAGSPRLRSLEQWLARADVAREAVRNRTAWLARTFGVEPLPVAALERLGAGLPADGAWMRADPVHLRVEGDAIRLYDASILELDHEEAAALSAALQAHFAGDGLEFIVHAPQRWHLRLGDGPAPRTTALDDAAGRNVFGLLPDDARWRNNLTEAQMILAGHDVNARREGAGKPAVNSVWFWGGGELPTAAARPYAAIYADDALARGLATWSGAQCAAVPAALESVDLHRAHEAILVALPSGHAPGIDARWFASLGDAVERFDRVRLILPSAAGTVVATLTGSARWRWFRPARPLSAYA